MTPPSSSRSLLLEGGGPGPLRTRPAHDASLYNARPLLQDLHHADTADVHRRIRSVRLFVLLHV